MTQYKILSTKMLPYPRSIIDTKNRVARKINSLVTGSALHHRAEHVEPMRGDIERHGKLKSDRPRRVEHGQDDAQAHCGTSISEHVEHGAELGALAEITGRVAVERVQ